MFSVSVDFLLLFLSNPKPSVGLMLRTLTSTPHALLTEPARCFCGMLIFITPFFGPGSHTSELISNKFVFGILCYLCGGLGWLEGKLQISALFRNFKELFESLTIIL